MTEVRPPEQRTEEKREEWYEKTGYLIILAVVGTVLFGLVVGFALHTYIEPADSSTKKKDLVQALGLITAGTAGAVGIVFTWRGQRDARKAQEDNLKNTQAQLKNAQEQLRHAQQTQVENQRTTQAQLENARNELDITRRGQITERFTRAIDQLGSDSLEITLGGIYSLERTAREDRDYHWPIMEVLTTFVRQRAPRNSGDAPDEEADEQGAPPDPAIQAILTVIGRRSDDHKDVEYVLDLRDAVLRKADLHGADLEGANFEGANLSGAVLYGTKLGEARLLNANLYRAILYGANLRGANLEGANLSWATFYGANLQGANLRRANLWGANFHEAILREATLEKANLRSTNLQYADLRGANLEGANLEIAPLYGANLEEVNFQGADLRRADLRGTIGLTEEQVRQVVGSQSTQLPDHLEHLSLRLLWPPYA